MDLSITDVYDCTQSFTHFLANMYLVKVSNRNTRKRCEICSKLTMKISEYAINVILLVLLLTEYTVNFRIHFKYQKITTRKIPNTDTSHAV